MARLGPSQISEIFQNRWSSGILAEITETGVLIPEKNNYCHMRLFLPFIVVTSSKLASCPVGGQVLSITHPTT